MSLPVHPRVSLAFAARAAATLLIGATCAVGIGGAASADTIDNDGFEGFAVGDPVGQFGWTAQDIGVYNASHFDLGIVDPSSVWTSGELGTRALRVSNAVTSDGYGNQLQTPSLADEAGETGAENLGFSGGTRQSRLSGSFTFASATRTYQAGLGVTFSPDRGDGARMSWIRLTDQPGGMQVEVAYYSNHAYAYAVVASGLSRDEPHVLDFTLDLVDGPNNDVLWVSVGGECGSWAQSGSWEDSHRDWAPGNPTKTVDSLLIRVGGVKVPTVAGGGFFIDDVSLTSSTVPPMPPLGTPTALTTPSARVNLTAVSVTGTPVATNACAPVTTYTVSAWPLGGGAPATFTSPTPTFSFPTPFGGAFTATMSATNSQGTSADAPVSLLFDPVFAGDGGAGELAATGTDASGLLAAATVMISVGAAMLDVRRRRTSRTRFRLSRP
jgi:hypothetical protein